MPKPNKEPFGEDFSLGITSFLGAFFIRIIGSIPILVAIVSLWSCAPLRGSVATGDQIDAAAQLVFRAWGTEAGLPQNSVNAMVQTRDGYLWLGTRDGLARFDGVRFTVFGLREGLPSVEVQTLYEDSQGTLWIGTAGGGLSRWVGGHIENVSFPAYLVASGTVTSMAQDAHGRLWIGTRAGLAIWEHGRFVQEPELARLEHAGVRCLLYDHSDVMWIGTLSDGLFEFRDNRLLETFESSAKDPILAYCLLEDTQGEVWASIGNGTLLCRQSGEWRRFTETNGVPYAYITCLGQDRSGTVWAGSLDDGLYCFQAGHFYAIRKQQGLSANDIRSLCPDREGNLWIGTRTGGFNRLSRRRLTSYGVAQGLTNDYTRSVAQTADGVLWVGTTGGGLYRGGAQGFAPFAPYFSSVESVLAARDGTLWWGAARGMFRLHQNGSIDSYTTESWLKAAAVTALAEDDRGGLWAGTYEGAIVHFQNGAFKEIETRVARGAITGLAQEPRGRLWVGSMAGGLERLDLHTEAVEPMNSGLPSQSIRTIYLDSEGALWIGTAGGGLSRYQQGRFSNFTSRQGLTASTVVQIVEDNYGFLWLGTSHGVLRVRKSDLENVAAGKLDSVHPRAFGINEGMSAEECSSGFFPAGLKTRSGLICISTVKGLVLFDPRNQVANAPPVNVLLEDVLANAQLQQPELETAKTEEGADSSPTASKLVLPAGSRELEIHYTAINFTSAEKLRFRYRLEGADHGWIEAGERRTAYYHHVPPGDFLFRVLACNADGLWSVSGPTLAITVMPYPWEHTWFRVLAAVVVLALMAGIIRLVERRRYRQRLALIETRHAVERERLRISQDMHDDIGSVLTQVSQLSDLGHSETGGASAMRGIFERIGGQARAAVQSLDEIVWATNPRNDDLPHFAEYICRFADELFEGSSIRCWQEVPTDLPKAALTAEIRHNVFLALKEAFTNVLKHSCATEVWLRLSVRTGQVCVWIEDNGRGFEVAKSRDRGNGLENIVSRLTSCGGEAELASTPGSGTKIRLQFPLRPPP